MFQFNYNCKFTRVKIYRKILVNCTVIKIEILIIKNSNNSKSAKNQKNAVTFTI